MADFVPGGDENRSFRQELPGSGDLRENDDPDLRGLRIRALGVSDAETLFERASGKNEISYSSSINATVKWLMNGQGGRRMSSDRMRIIPSSSASAMVRLIRGARKKHRASARRCIRRKRNSSRSGIQGRCPPRCPALHSGGGSEEGAGKQHEEFPCPCQSAEAYRRSGRV